MVKLVFQGLGEEPLTFDANFPTKAVESLNRDLLRALDLPPITGDTEAPLLNLALSGPLHNLGIHENYNLLIGQLDYRYPQRDPYLRSCKPHATHLPHGLHHVIDELRYRSVDTANTFRFLTKYRVVIINHGKYCH